MRRIHEHRCQWNTEHSIIAPFQTNVDLSVGRSDNDATHEVTVVDIGKDGLETHKAHGDTIAELLEAPLPSGHCRCRWININRPPPNVILTLRECTQLESICTPSEVMSDIPGRLDWSRDYVGASFTMLRLGHAANTPSDSRWFGTPELEVLQERAYIIITFDNKVVTLFDSSAHGVDISIKAMAGACGAFRDMCDPSLLVQAVISIIIDRSTSVQTAYANVVSNLEMDALLKPEMQRTHGLYKTLINIHKMVKVFTASRSLINALRDQRLSEIAGKTCTRFLERSRHGILITPQANIRLESTASRCSMIVKSLDELTEVVERALGFLLQCIRIRRRRVMALMTCIVLLLLVAIGGLVLYDKKA
ncbi:hypothetical protein ACJZ2D_006263 [Fusarium nematophilum]